MERFRNDRGMTGESGLSLEELINLKNKAFIDETGDYNELISRSCGFTSAAQMRR